MAPTFSSIRISQFEPDIAVLTLDSPGSGANILNQTMFVELDQAMEMLAARSDIEGLIVTSAKPKIFIAGADLRAIATTLDWTNEQIVTWCEKGRAVMARFSRCPFVTVAAIQGACVGGGLELALWCDCRIASEDRRTQLGLPEVKLGLVPGWAGTARLPRLIGFAAAAEMIVSGKLVSATSAKSLGIVDELVGSENLLPAAAQMIRRVQTSQSFIHNRRTIMGPVAHSSDLPAVIKRLAEQIVNNQEIFPYAPTVALEHLARTAALDQPAVWKSESVAMAQVYGSPANRGLLNHFFLLGHNKKQPGLVDLSLKTQPIQRIGIVGAGLMGRAIAQNCLGHSVSVVIYDAVPELATQAAADLKSDREAASNVEIRAADDYLGFADVDMVIESVVETLAVKSAVLKRIEAAVAPTTWIASNTSAIPISRLAMSLEHPERFCGIHFCHPELMSLVEVVCGDSSSESSVATAVQFVRAIGKMAVAMNDGAGFVVNRLLAAMLDQSIRILMTGVPIEQIDAAVREFGFRGGPFEIIDVIGTDTCMYAGRTMWESGLSCVSLSPILPRLVKLKRLGRKSGAGFYRYAEPRGPGQHDPELLPIIASYLDQDAVPEKKKTAEQQFKLDAKKMVTQILSAMVLEATRILDEDIVADYRDIELCVIDGFSFPAHRGGILYWADQVGLETINQTLNELSENAPHLEPTEKMKRMQAARQKFYAD